MTRPFFSLPFVLQPYSSSSLSTKARVVSISLFVAKSSLVIFAFSAVVLHARNCRNRCARQSRLSAERKPSRSNEVVTALINFWDHWRRVTEMEDHNSDSENDLSSVDSRRLDILRENESDGLLDAEDPLHGNRVACYCRDRLCESVETAERVPHPVHQNHCCPSDSHKMAGAREKMKDISTNTSNNNNNNTQMSSYRTGIVSSFVWPPRGVRHSCDAVNSVNATNINMNPHLNDKNALVNTVKNTPDVYRVTNHSSRRSGEAVNSPSLVYVSPLPKVRQKGISFSSTASTGGGLAPEAGDSLLTSVAADTFGHSSDGFSPSYTSQSWMASDGIGIPQSPTSLRSVSRIALALKSHHYSPMRWLGSLLWPAVCATCGGREEVVVVPRLWWSRWRQSSMGNASIALSCPQCGRVPNDRNGRSILEGNYIRWSKVAGTSGDGTDRPAPAEAGRVSPPPHPHAIPKLPDLLAVPFITDALSSVFRPLIPTLGRCPTVVVLRVCPSSEDSEREIEEYVSDLKRQLQLDSSCSEDDLLDIVCILESDRLLDTPANDEGSASPDGRRDAEAGLPSSHSHWTATPTNVSSPQCTSPLPYDTLTDTFVSSGAGASPFLARQQAHMTLEIYPARMFYLTLYLGLLLQEKNNAILSVFGGPKISCTEPSEGERKKQARRAPTSSPFSPFSRSVGGSTPPPSSSRQTPVRSSNPFSSSLPSPSSIFSPKSRKKRFARTREDTVPHKQFVNLDAAWQSASIDENVNCHNPQSKSSTGVSGARVVLVEELEEVAEGEGPKASSPITTLHRKKGKEVYSRQKASPGRSQKTRSTTDVRKNMEMEGNPAPDAEGDSVSGAAVDIASKAEPENRGEESGKSVTTRSVSASTSKSRSRPNSTLTTPTTRDPAPFLPAPEELFPPPACGSPVRHAHPPHTQPIKLTPLSTYMDEGCGGAVGGSGIGRQSPHTTGATTSGSSRIVSLAPLDPSGPSVVIQSRWIFSSLSKRSMQALKAADLLMDDVREKMDENVKAYWDKKMALRNDLAEHATLSPCHACGGDHDSRRSSESNNNSTAISPSNSTKTKSHPHIPGAKSSCCNSGITGPRGGGGGAKQLSATLLSSMKTTTEDGNQPPTAEDMATLVEELEIVEREACRDRVLARVRPHAYTVCSIGLPDHRIYRSVPLSVARCAVACARGFCLYRSLTDDALHQQQYVLHVLEVKQREAMRANEESVEETPQEETGRRVALLKKLAHLMNFANFSFQRPTYSSPTADNKSQSGESAGRRRSEEQRAAALKHDEEERLRAQRINDHFLAVSAHPPPKSSPKTVLYSVEDSGFVNVSNISSNTYYHHKSRRTSVSVLTSGVTVPSHAGQPQPYDSNTSPNPPSSTQTYSPTVFYENSRDNRRVPKMWSGLAVEEETRSYLSRRGSLLMSSLQATPQPSNAYELTHSVGERAASAGCSFRYCTPLDYSSSVCSAVDGVSRCSSMGSRSVSCLMDTTTPPVLVPPLPKCRELLLWLRGAFCFRCCAANVEHMLRTNGCSRLNWIGHGKMAFFVFSNATARLFCASVGDEVDDDMEWLREGLSDDGATAAPGGMEPKLPHFMNALGSSRKEESSSNPYGIHASGVPGQCNRVPHETGGAYSRHRPASATLLPGGQSLDDEGDEFIDRLKRERSRRNRPLYPILRFLHQQFFDTLTRPSRSQASSVTLTPSLSNRNSLHLSPAASPSIPSPFSLNPLPTPGLHVANTNISVRDAVLPPPLTLSTAALAGSGSSDTVAPPVTRGSTSILLLPPHFSSQISSKPDLPAVITSDVAPSPEKGKTNHSIVTSGDPTPDVEERCVNDPTGVSAKPKPEDAGENTSPTTAERQTLRPSLTCFGGYRVPLDALDKNNGHYGLTPLEVWMSSRYSLRTAAEVYVMDVAATRGDPYISSVRVVDEVVAHAVYVYHNRSLMEFVMDLNAQFQLKYIPQTAWGKQALSALPWVREVGTGGTAEEIVSEDGMGDAFRRHPGQVLKSTAKGAPLDTSNGARHLACSAHSSVRGGEMGTDSSEADVLTFVDLDLSSNGSREESDHDKDHPSNDNDDTVNNNKNNNTWDMDLDAYSVDAFGVENEEESLSEELEFLKLFLLSHRHVLSSAMLTPAKANRLESLFGVPSTVFPFLLCQRESVGLVYSIFQGLTEHYGQLTYHHFYQFMLDVFGADRPEVVRHTPRIFRALNRSRTGCISYEELCGWLARKLSCGTQQKPDIQLIATLTSLRLHMALVTDRKDAWEHRDFILRSLSEGEEQFH